MLIFRMQNRHGFILLTGTAQGTLCTLWSCFWLQSIKSWPWSHSPQPRNQVCCTICQGLSGYREPSWQEYPFYKPKPLTHFCWDRKHWCIEFHQNQSTRYLLRAAVSSLEGEWPSWEWPGCICRYARGSINRPDLDRQQWPCWICWQQCGSCWPRSVEIQSSPEDGSFPCCQHPGLSLSPDILWTWLQDVEYQLLPSKEQSSWPRSI